VGLDGDANAPSLGKPLAGESHAVASPEVSVIHDFFPYEVKPPTVAGRPAAGLGVQPPRGPPLAEVCGLEAEA